MGLIRKIIDTENPLVRVWFRHQISLRRKRHNQIYFYALLLISLFGLLGYTALRIHQEAADTPGKAQYRGGFEDITIGILFAMLWVMSAATTFVPSGGLGSHFSALRKRNQLEPLLLTTVTSREHFHSLWVGHGLFHVITWTIFSTMFIVSILLEDSPSGGGEYFEAVMFCLLLLTYPALQTLWSFSIGLFFQTRMQNPRVASYASAGLLILPGVLFLLLAYLFEDGTAPVIIITIVKLCIAPTLFLHVRQDLNRRLLKTIHPD